MRRGAISRRKALSPFGQRVDAAMVRLGLSESDLGQLMGVDGSTVSHWLKHVYPPVPRFEKLCRVLNTSPNVLLGWEPLPEIRQETLAGPLSDLKRAVRALEALSRPPVIRSLRTKKEATHGQ